MSLIAYARHYNTNYFKKWVCTTALPFLHRNRKSHAEQHQQSTLYVPPQFVVKLGAAPCPPVAAEVAVALASPVPTPAKKESPPVPPPAKPEPQPSPGYEAAKRFTFEGQSLRTVEHNGEVWFVASDACEILGIVNTSQAIQGLDSADKGTGSAPTLGGVQQVSIISEDGLIDLVMASRKPKAKEIKRWLITVVLSAKLEPQTSPACSCSCHCESKNRTQKQAQVEQFLSHMY
jgi:prophage antirepressor-like protein